MAQNTRLVPNSLSQATFQLFRDFAKKWLNFQQKLIVQ